MGRPAPDGQTHGLAALIVGPEDDTRNSQMALGRKHFPVTVLVSLGEREISTFPIAVLVS